MASRVKRVGSKDNDKALPDLAALSSRTPQTVIQPGEARKTSKPLMTKNQILAFHRRSRSARNWFRRSTLARCFKWRSRLIRDHAPNHRNAMITMNAIRIQGLSIISEASGTVVWEKGASIAQGEKFPSLHEKERQSLLAIPPRSVAPSGKSFNEQIAE